MPDGQDGIFVTFDHYIRMNDGRIERNREQVAFPGPIDVFKKRHPNFAIIGYHTMEDGVVTEECVMLNEKLPPLEGKNEAVSGVITPELMQQAVNNSSVQENAAKNTQEATVVKQQPQISDKILKDGDSYIKISGGKVFKLKWVEYDDEKADFDKKIKWNDGHIMITHWEELAE